MIYRFAVREAALYFHHSVPYMIRPGDFLKLIGGTEDSFFCNVTRDGAAVVGGIEIPVADIDRVRFTVNGPVALSA